MTRANIDYSLKGGDWVYSRYWSMGQVQVVDINWALRAAAVQLFAVDGKPGGIVVWTVENLSREDNRKDKISPCWRAV